MRGRSFTALTGRILTTRTGAQSPSGTSPRCSRHVGLIEPALEVAFVPSSSIFCAEGAFGGFSVSAGASAIASRGSRSCCRLKMPKLIAPAINPQTENATNVRQNLEVPTYPNSGCRTRTRDTTTTHAPIPPSYHSPSSALGQNYILVNCGAASPCRQFARVARSNGRCSRSIGSRRNRDCGRWRAPARSSTPLVRFPVQLGPRRAGQWMRLSHGDDWHS